MKVWAQDLLELTAAHESDSELVVFGKIQRAAESLGFEYSAYGRRLPLPLSRPKIQIINNYPTQWRERYMEAGYLAIDPTVEHGRHTSIPLVWSDEVFSMNPQLWAEAKAAGLQVGWAQSSLDGYGVGGMLTLVRSSERLTPSELALKEVPMRWLVQIAHLTLSRALNAQHSDPPVGLTPRETEVLKWHADGKTSEEIADILTISKDTVKFHTKNAVAKLGSANKTAAVVRAAMLGLLN